MDSDTSARDAPRRDFLKLATLGAVAGGAAAVAGGVAEAAETSDPAEGAGYRESPHIRTYYDTARF